MATDVQQYGCDRCGKQKDEHIGDYGGCPDRPEFSHATWQDSLSWADNGHRLGAEISYGRIRPKLYHPDKCTPAFCICRGEDYITQDADPNCEHCGGTGEDPTIPCWLQHFIDENDGEFEDCTPWVIPIDITEPIPILYHGGWEDFEWRPRGL